MSDTTEYSRGYNAGRNKHAKDLRVAQEELRLLKLNIEDRNERIYMKCLKLALEHCSGWTVGGERIKNAQGYCQMAKIFADNSISEMDN